jgi:hypothetical protein
MPRVALAGVVGAMLSLAGASYQGVFRNPLVDPYLLGVAAGAGLGAHHGRDAVVGEERIAGFGRVRDVREGPDGALYVLSESTGRLYRLTPSN